MTPLLPGAASFSVFVAASLILALTPGPVVLFVLARTTADGLRAGLVSVCAAALGNLGSALGAALGLAAIFKVSATAFTVVKLAGAGYLLYLAVAALRSGSTAAARGGQGHVRLRTVFRDGVMVALLNPKTALFFAAFLPQFVTPGADSARQCIALGAIFVLLALCTDSIYAVVAATARARLTRIGRGSRVGSYAAAGVYASLGLYAAFSGAGAAKG
jgi:threonine/homoserine/homoserine lactone efflux protein